MAYIYLYFTFYIYTRIHMYMKIGANGVTLCDELPSKTGNINS